MKVAHVAVFRGAARLVPRYTGIVTYGNRKRKMQNNFLCFRLKRANLRNNFYNSILDVLRDLHASKCKKEPRNRPPMHPYGNLQNAMKLTRANISDLLQALKQLMETMLLIAVHKLYRNVLYGVTS